MKRRREGKTCLIIRDGGQCGRPATTTFNKGGLKLPCCLKCADDCRRGRVKPRNKYNARKAELDGITFDSQREARYYLQLRSLLQTGGISELERQVKFDLHGPRGGLIGRYTLDFCFRENGKQVAAEVKGYRTRDYLLRRKLFVDEYGHEWEHREV